MKSTDSLKTAFRRASKNIFSEGVSDVDLLGRPFEADYLNDRVFLNKVEQDLVSRIEKGTLDSLRLGAIKHVLVPKKTLADFRNCAVIDIVDELIYLTLTLAIARTIETRRIQKSREIVFSYRFQFDDKSGRLFDPKYSLSAFLARTASLKRKSSYSVMVSCDIAGFYDRLNLHRLNSTLLSLPKMDCDIANMLDQILLFWSGRNSYGLPIGSNASRILAEAELIEVDNYLINHNVEFCRFVDDYRIFAKNADEANKHLEYLVFALQREGLFLNSGKTKVEDISNISATEDAERLQEEESTTIPADKKAVAEMVNHPLVIAGYSGLIPLKYRMPSESESEKLRTFSLNDLMQEVESQVVLDSSKFRELLKSIQVQNKYEHLRYVVPLVNKCPQFIPYVVDFCIKNAESIPDDISSFISDYFEERFLDNRTPEYVRIALCRLYSSAPFQRISVLTQAFSQLSRESGGHIGRVILDCIAGKTNRLQTMNIRDFCQTTDIQELRSLAKVVAKGLPAPESAPFLKNLKIRYSDPFLAELKAQEKDDIN